MLEKACTNCYSLRLMIKLNMVMAWCVPGVMMVVVVVVVMVMVCERMLR